MRKGRPFDSHAHGAIINFFFPVDNGISPVTSFNPFVPLSNYAVPSGLFYAKAGLKGFVSADVLRRADVDRPRSADVGLEWGLPSPGSLTPPALPDANSNSTAAYPGAPDPLEFNGLPTAPRYGDG